MRVSAFSLSMSSQYQAVQTHTLTRISQAAPSAPDNSASDAVTLSAASRQSQAIAGDQDTTLPALQSLIKRILEQMLGVQFHLATGKDAPDKANAAPDPQNQSAPSTPAAGSLVASSESYSESASLSFKAEGKLSTADGQSFSFSLSVNLSYSYQSNLSTVTDNRQNHDPLSITLGDQAGSFSGATALFDLQSNGQSLNMPFPNQGGWLVDDNQSDGQVHDGRQLFGPASGNGFNDLAKLDSNGDGAIDEADPGFARLKLWQGKDAQGKDMLMSLTQAGIGALLLPSISTPFSIKDSQHQQVGALRSSGVYLREDGQAGQIAQVDVTA